MTAKIRLLLADDEHLIRGALEALLGLEPDIEVVASTDNGVVAAERCPLTDRELDALRASRVTSSVPEIADQLFLSPGTVRNYLSSAMSKIGVSSRHAAAEHAWQQGWI